jgi:hypothetical protein
MSSRTSWAARVAWWLRPGGGRVVVRNDQQRDVAVGDVEVVGQDEFSGQAGLVVLAIHDSVHDGDAVLVPHVADVHGDFVADDLALDPVADRRPAAELSAGIVHQGVAGEHGGEGVGLECVARADVLRYRGGQGWCEIRIGHSASLRSPSGRGSRQAGQPG